MGSRGGTDEDGVKVRFDNYLVIVVVVVKSPDSRSNGFLRAYLTWWT